MLGGDPFMEMIDAQTKEIKSYLLEVENMKEAIRYEEINGI